MNTGGLKQDWNERAEATKGSLQGVLFKNFPLQANHLLHDWHAWLVRNLFAPHIRTAGSVLDLGCGYGRLSNVLQACRNDLAIVGQDISEQYCDMYRSMGRLAVVADQSSLPFEDSSFDAVFSVTSLMYSQDNIESVLFEISRVLKPEGVVFIIDPGEEVLDLIRKVRKTGNSGGPVGKGFSKMAYLDMLNKGGFRVISKGGNPFFSLCALASFGKFRPISLVDRLSKLDSRAGGYWSCALHRWVLAKVYKVQPTND